MQVPRPTNGKISQLEQKVVVAAQCSNSSIRTIQSYLDSGWYVIAIEAIPVSICATGTSSYSATQTERSDVIFVLERYKK